MEIIQYSNLAGKNLLVADRVQSAKRFQRATNKFQKTASVHIVSGEPQDIREFVQFHGIDAAIFHAVALVDEQEIQGTLETGIPVIVLASVVHNGITEYEQMFHRLKESGAAVHLKPPPEYFNEMLWGLLSTLLVKKV